MNFKKILQRNKTESDHSYYRWIVTKWILCVNKCEFVNISRSFKICERGVNECLSLLSNVKTQLFEPEKSEKWVAKPMVLPCETKGFRRWNQGNQEVKPRVSQLISLFFVDFFEWNNAANRATNCNTIVYLFRPANCPEGARTRPRLLNFKISPGFLIRFLTLDT